MCIVCPYQILCIYSSKDLVAVAVRLFVKDIFSAAVLLCYILQTDYVTELYLSKVLFAVPPHKNLHSPLAFTL